MPEPSDHSVDQSDIVRHTDLTEKSLNQSDDTGCLDNEDNSFSDDIKFIKSIKWSESDCHENISEEKDLSRQTNQPEVLSTQSDLTDTQGLHNKSQNISSGTVLVNDSLTNDLVKVEESVEIVKDHIGNLETVFIRTSGSPLYSIPKTIKDIESETDLDTDALGALERDEESVQELSDCGFCDLEDRENLIHSTESSDYFSCDIVENNWPLAIDDNVIVNFLELEDKCFEDGDFSFFVKESDSGKVGLYVKYFVNGSYREVLIPEGEFGNLFTMEWQDEFLSESSEDLGASLQNCLVSLEDSVDKLRWENVVASMGPFHHGNVKLKHSLMSKPGNSSGVSNTNHDSAFPKHVFSSDSGFNRNSPRSDCDKRPANFVGDKGDYSSVGRQGWQNTSYHSAVSRNSQGKENRYGERMMGIFISRKYHST